MTVLLSTGDLLGTIDMISIFIGVSSSSSPPRGSAAAVAFTSEGPWRWVDLAHNPSANHISVQTVSADVSTVSPSRQLIVVQRKLAFKAGKVVEPSACSHWKLNIKTDACSFFFLYSYNSQFGNLVVLYLR